MKKLIAAIAIAVAVLGFAGTVAAAKPKPTPAQVQAYECAVAKTNTGVCQQIPGPWNGFAGRVTPQRWDPCLGGMTIFYRQSCGPMTPTVAQWCTLHFDHRVAGWDICAARQPWT